LITGDTETEGWDSIVPTPYSSALESRIPTNTPTELRFRVIKRPERSIFDQCRPGGDLFSDAQSQRPFRDKSGGALYTSDRELAAFFGEMFSIDVKRRDLQKEGLLLSESRLPRLL
jgi:hypothetical protein